jgi:integrase
MVFHCFTYLKAMCAEAVDQDFLLKDPARKLKRPKTRKPDETVLEWSQYQSVIDAAKTLRDKLAIKVGSGTAVRPGELFAFRWRSLERLSNGRHALRVTETVYKSKLRPWAKTQGSEDYVPLPKRLAAELLAWRTLAPAQGQQDFIFANSQGGFMDYENFEARVLGPIRLELGLVKLNFQILRRTYATRAVGERKGTLKDVQKQLRHSRPNTTLENYVKEVPESVYRMVDAMYDKITGTSQSVKRTNDVLERVVSAGGIQ